MKKTDLLKKPIENEKTPNINGKDIKCLLKSDKVLRELYNRFRDGDRLGVELNFAQLVAYHFLLLRLMQSRLQILIQQKMG